jgi:hypothetical protein
MTDFTVRSTAYQVEKRSWLQSMPDADDCDSIVLDISKFTAGTHFPNGFIPSGCGLAKVTATGLYGPYDTTAERRPTAHHGAAVPAVQLVDVVHKDGSSATQARRRRPRRRYRRGRSSCRSRAAPARSTRPRRPP